MDKRVIFAVAGSGKTTYLINQLDEDKKFLLITYTNNNAHNLRTGIISKFGYFPENIKLFTYYSFLYGFCYKPFLHQKLGTRGINYEPIFNRFIKSNKREYFIDKFDRLYSSRISKLLIAIDEHMNVVDRISKYFDYLFIDEIQDFAGNDFNLLTHISTASINQIYVGDFFQHTFDTSRDGTTNSRLHDNMKAYIKEFARMGLTIDTTTLSKSFRCSPSICEFITDQLGITIESHRTDATNVVFTDNPERATEIFNDQRVVKLFYKEHYKYNCFSRNWGDSKGEDKYFDVCIVLNKTTLDNYQKGRLSELAPTTRNKLYVALTRSRNDLFLIPDSLLTHLTQQMC